MILNPHAVDSSKIETELGWSRTFSFDKGLKKTVEWYLNNQDWLENIQSGKYHKVQIIKD